MAEAAERMTARSLLKGHVSRRLAGFLLTTGMLFAAVYLISRQVPEAEIRALIRDVGPAGPLLLVGLLLLTNIIAPVSSSPLVFAGFYVFGQDVVLYTFVASWLSMVSNFLIARRVGRRAIERLVGQANVDRVDQFSRTYGLIALFVLRVFESEIQKVISYAFGLTSIDFPRYVIVSTIGMIPGALAWYLLSGTAQGPLMFTLLTQALGIGLSGVFIVGGILLRQSSGRLRRMS